MADGPGPLSFDALVGKKKWGAGWALFALVAGAAASTAVIEAGRRAAPAPVEEAAGETSSDSSSSDADGTA